MSAKACLAHQAQSTPSRLRRGRLDQFTQSSTAPAARGVGRAGSENLYPTLRHHAPSVEESVDPEAVPCFLGIRV
jgi:hypothetical protein